MPLVAQLSIILCAFFGGSTAVVAKPLLDGIAPLALVALRFFLSALAIAVVMRRVVFPVSRAALVAGVITGVGFGFGCALLYLALDHMQPGRLLFIAGLEVVLVPLICGVFLKTKMRSVEKYALGPAGVGLYLLIGDISGASVWDVVAITSALCYCLYTISLTHIAPASNLASRSFISFLTIAALSFLASVSFEQPRDMTFTWYLPFALFYLVALGSVGRFVLQGWAQRQVSATFTAVAFTSEPVFALGLSYLFLGEMLTGTQSIGAVLILLAVLGANLPEKSV